MNANIGSLMALGLTITAQAALAQQDREPLTIEQGLGLFQELCFDARGDAAVTAAAVVASEEYQIFGPEGIGMIANGLSQGVDVMLMRGDPSHNCIVHFLPDLEPVAAVTETVAQLAAKLGVSEDAFEFAGSYFEYTTDSGTIAVSPGRQVTLAVSFN